MNRSPVDMGGSSIGRLPTRCRPPMDLNQCLKAQEQMLLEGNTRSFTPIPTGFSWLDERLGGGLHAADLNLFGGKQNLGKTADTLQWAVSFAANFSPRAFPIFICYEHMELELFQRILCLQSASTAKRIGKEPFTVLDLENAYRQTVTYVKVHPKEKVPVFDMMLSLLPSSASPVIDDVSKYMSNMWLITGVPNYTHTDAIRSYLRMCWEQFELPMVLFVDYIQRIPIPLQTGVILTPEQRAEYIVRELDSIAKEFVIPVVGIAAADEKALRQGRVHIENLFGTNALQYDPSVCVIINYDHSDDDNNKYVRFSLEKNRRGPTDLECVLPYDGPHYHFLHDQAKDVPLDQSWQLERHALREEMQNRQIMQQLANIGQLLARHESGSASAAVETE